MSKINFIEKNHNLFLAIVFIILYILGFLFIQFDVKTRIDAHLVSSLETTNVEYKLIYNIYKKNSKLVFKEIINKAEIINIIADINDTNKDLQRKKLYNLLKNKYAFIQKLGVKQLHFHLKNNESFLRMHKPEKFGDDLSDFRYSVKYVNENHKAISGFEQGKVVHGFRYVYPLRDKNKKHIGSVEISIDSNNFKEMFENTLFIDAYILLDKKISTYKLFKDELGNHYSDSLESSKYLKTKNDNHDEKLKNYLHKHLKAYQAKIAQKLDIKKAFAIELNDGKNYYIKVFIPINNIKDKKVVAFFVTTSVSTFLDDTHKDAFILKILLFFILLIVIYALHKSLTYSTTLRKEIRKKTEELEESEKRNIEIKKMASLGTLITGIAHEINTPIGLSITAMTHFMDKTQALKKDYESQQMDQEEFENYLFKADSTLNLIFLNLVKSANLIKDFKQISMDEATLEKKLINVKKYIEDIVSSLNSKLKKNNVIVKLNVDESLELLTYASGFTQVISNLILNSLTHAFHNTNNATIIISATKNSKDIILHYEDNGIGMNEEQKKNIFEPFYTTNRGTGGTGLGMYIVFNLVTQKFGGTIELESELGAGVKYIVTLPKEEK